MDYDVFREELAIKHPGYGHALWEPSPPAGARYHAVQIGDVGYIRRGSFHRLFNVLLPEDDESHRGSVPPHHKPLEIRMPQPTRTGTLVSNNFRSKGVSAGLEMHKSRPDQQSFTCSRERGAVLCLPVSAQRDDTEALGEFGKYMIKHIDEWFAFVRELGTGISRREDIVLVTGCDLARSWANFAFQDKDERVSFDVKTFGDSHVEWAFTSEGAGGVACNHGPNGKDLPENQCIFIRGFRATRIAMIIPRLRAAAGPFQTPGPCEDDPDPDTQLIGFPFDTHYQDPFYTLLKYIAIQAPDCDMALLHDNDLLCIDVASLDSLQPDPLMSYLWQSAPKVWQFECDRSPTINTDEGASTAEARTRATTIKVATLSNYTFNEPIVANALEMDGQRPMALMSPPKASQSIGSADPPLLKYDVPAGTSSPSVLVSNALRTQDSKRSSSKFSSIATAIGLKPETVEWMFSVILDRLILLERHHLIPIVISVCLVTAFLERIYRSKEHSADVVSMFLLGSLTWLIWSNFKLMHGRLDDLSEKIEALQHSIRVESRQVESTPAYMPAGFAPGAVVLDLSSILSKDFLSGINASKPTPSHVVGPDDTGPKRPAEFSAAFEKPYYTSYEISTPVSATRVDTENRSPAMPPASVRDNVAEVSDVRTPVIPPAIIKNLIPPPPVPPAAPSPDPLGGLILEGLDNVISVLEGDIEYVTPPMVNPPPSVPSAPGLDRGEGAQVERMESIVRKLESGASTASGSAEQPVPKTQTRHGFSHWLPVLREIKLRIEQAAEGKIQRISHQSQSSILLSLRRWAVRLLMSAASLSPANFEPQTGFLGPPESTPYYPTGDLEGDRSIAFTTVMDCIGNLEAYLQGDDAILVSTKLFELGQALNDLGLRDDALKTSGFALEALGRPYNVVPNNSRLHVASILSLRSNILCDLKKQDEANSAGDRAVSLCREHKDSQTAPVPELTYALLNHAVILNFMGLQEESAAVASELLCGNELDDSRPDMVNVSALCRLCLSNTRIGTDNDMASSMAEEAIEITAKSSDATSQTVQAGALLAKSKILASREQNDAAYAISAEAVTLLRSMSAAHPVFSLFLAHALDTHAHHLSEANRKGESYSVRKDAVELWQTLNATAGGAVARPLAWSFFELSKFRHKGDRNALREELRLAESAVELFRVIEPLDAPGLGGALYLYADRMLELDQNQEAVTYAKESVDYFQEASNKDPKYALDLIFSLSLASACLARTGRADYALEYAKLAVEVQHGRIGVSDKQYDAHLRKLLTDIVFRATEKVMQDEAASWLQELQDLGGLGEKSGAPLAQRSGNFQDDEFRKQTSYWMDANADAPRSNDGSSSSTPAASSSMLRVHKGKGEEVPPSPELRSSTRVDKGKAKEVDPQFDSSTLGHQVEEEMSPGADAAATARRRLASLGNTVLMQGNASGGGPGGSDPLSGSLGSGGARDMDGSKGGHTLSGPGVR